jgi:hypothetical protein
MSISMSVPLDHGFLRRECPHCERQFKWHHRPTESRPQDAVDPDVYFCPYCGQTAPLDQWLTKEQAECAQRLALGEGMRLLEDEFKELERGPGGMMQFKFESSDVVEPPLPLHEPEDMMVVQSPCHPWEPIKIDVSWSEPLHCLVCGNQFAIG